MTTTFGTSYLPQFDRGTRLGDIRDLTFAVTNLNANSNAYGITAIGSTQATAQQLNSVLNEVSVVTASSGVNLPYTLSTKNQPYQICVVINNGANALQVYAAQGKTDTINGTAGATGIAQPAGSANIYVSAKPGAWSSAGSLGAGSFTSITDTGNLTFTTQGAGIIQKQGANGRANSLVLNGATPVIVTNTSFTTGDSVLISLATVGGTVGAIPHLQTVTYGTGFTVVGTASDTSTYNYQIFGSAA